MSDLIARLLDVCQCNLDSSPCGNEDTCLLLREAAEALEAKDAEMREHQKALAAERADVASALAEARDKLDAQDAETAALRARLTAAEKIGDMQGSLQDSAYLAGMAAGWRFGEAGHRAGYDATVRAYRGYLKPIRDKQDAAKETGDGS